MNYEESNRVLREKLHEISLTDDTSGFEISSSIRILANMYDSILMAKDGERGITGPRMGILTRMFMDEAIGCGHPMTPTNLSEFQNVSKNTISSHIKGLEDQGYIIREVDPDDKRMYHPTLTDKGKALVKQEAPMRAVLLNLASSELTEEERHQLVVLLQKLRKSMISQIRKGNVPFHRHFRDE